MLVMFAAAGLAALVAAPLQAQNAFRGQAQQARVNQVRDQVQSNALHEQQRQQTSATTRKAFQHKHAKSQSRDADQAHYDRYRARQRTLVDDYRSQSQTDKPKASHKPRPAHSSSSH